MPQALIDALIQLGLNTLSALIPQIGELIIQGITALMHSIISQNTPSDLPPLEARAIARAKYIEAQQCAKESVMAIDAADWGSFLTKAERDAAKATAAWNDYSGKMTDRGIVMTKNDKEAMLKLAVAAAHSDIDLGLHS